MRLGPYEMTALLGVGGMGEVYRATDTKLKRQVALKVIPAALMSHRDRLARFQREAEVLASLNHPNIGAIYGLEEANGVTALVLELVEGPTLADRIAHGPIPIDEALPIAKQVAEALEEAHARGVIHRDLKPANIKVRPDGVVKVLDFGLAKALGPTAAADPNTTESPTMTSPAVMTGINVILGTAAYMSPEQAKGRPADKRSDIWAFGCVLYEVLTGARAFDGKDMAEVLGAVTRLEPDWSRLPADTPPVIDTLLRGCLTKDPRLRLGDITAVLFAFKAASATPAAPRRDTTERASARRSLQLAWLLAGLVLVVTGVWLTRGASNETTSLPTTRFKVPAPDGVSLSLRAPELELSPDGRYLAFVGRRGTGPFQLYVRARDEVEARVIPGTDDAAKPFWSPDSKSIGFVVFSALKRVALEGGAPQTICTLDDSAEGLGAGGTWNRDDVILFGARHALYRVSASGGAPAVVLGGPNSPISYRWPQFLPDGRRFLVFQFSQRPSSQTGVYSGSLDSAVTSLVLATDYMARFSPKGYLLYVANGGLQAERFDGNSLRRLGETITLAPRVNAVQAANSRYASFSVSNNGGLAFGSGSDLRRLTWVDRAGTQLSVVGQADMYAAVELSRDGTQAVLEILDDGGRGDIWTLDVERDMRQPVTRTRDVWEFQPHWSPDDQYIAYGWSGMDGPPSIRRSQPGGSAPEETLTELRIIYGVSDWAPDGATLFLEEPRSTLPDDTRTAALQLRLSDGGSPTTPPHSRPSDHGFRMSPDRRFVAFVSSDTGQEQVYVRRTSGGPRVLVSKTGGSLPRWRRDGRELYYRGADNTLFAVSVDVQREAFGTPQLLFSAPTLMPTATRPPYATVDGSKFLLITRVDEEPSITWVVNGSGAPSRGLE